MQQKQDKAFVSELDQFLQTFDREHPTKSRSQQAEIDKHQRIAERRDDPEVATDDEQVI